MSFNHREECKAGVNHTPIFLHFYDLFAAIAYPFSIKDAPMTTKIVDTRNL
jgi:hypothetical protein